MIECIQTYWVYDEELEVKEDRQYKEYMKMRLFGVNNERTAYFR